MEDCRQHSDCSFFFSPYRMFEYGEAHFLSLLGHLEDTWKDLPAVPCDTPFPVDFLGAELENVSNLIVIMLVAQVKEIMDDLWLDSGLIEYERYHDCKAVIDRIKTQILEQLAGSDEERAEYPRLWPFD